MTEIYKYLQRKKVLQCTAGRKSSDGMAGEEISIIHNAEMWPETERKKGSKYCLWLL